MDPAAAYVAGESNAIMRGGFPWADEFDAYIRTNVLARRVGNVIDYHRAGASASLAFPTPDHFAPLLFALGASDEGDTVRLFNDQRVLGSLSMLSSPIGGYGASALEGPYRQSLRMIQTRKNPFTMAPKGAVPQCGRTE